MKSIKENYLFFIIILLLFLIDRITNQVLNILEDKNFIFINDFLNLNLVFNTGIGFGFVSRRYLL